MTVATSTATKAIKARIDWFREQKSDYDWLMIPLNSKRGRDEFKNNIVFAKFRSDLSLGDFTFYIDTTFSDLPANIRTKMRGMFVPKSLSHQEEDIIFDYEVAGRISTSLVQIISERNSEDELEVMVGVIKLDRYPGIGWHFNNDYWESDKERVKLGLQYLFACEAQKELQ